MIQTLTVVSSPVIDLTESPPNIDYYDFSTAPIGDEPPKKRVKLITGFSRNVLSATKSNATSFNFSPQPLPTRLPPPQGIITTASFHLPNKASNLLQNDWSTTATTTPINHSSESSPSVTSIRHEQNSTAKQKPRSHQSSRHLRKRHNASNPELNSSSATPAAIAKPASSLPYHAHNTRKIFSTGALATKNTKQAFAPANYHVDFDAHEVEAVWSCVLGKGEPSLLSVTDMIEDLSIISNNHSTAQLDVLFRDLNLPRRTAKEVANFLLDVKNNDLPLVASSLTLVRKAKSASRNTEAARASEVSNLLLAREMEGGWQSFGSSTMRTLTNFINQTQKLREDDMQLIETFSGGAGDVVTVTWVSDSNFICGCTSPSDPHNQQYNRRGNLILASSSLKQWRAFPNHRIPRKLTSEGLNATSDMQASQEPWIYTSVVSSAHDSITGFTFTSSFDKTVKIWKTSQDGDSMVQMGNWSHDGNVNFVAVSRHETGLVATAADVSSGAIRVYNLDFDDISMSPYNSYSSSRVIDQNGVPMNMEKWAYYPATMRWGICDEAKHLLLVGYSPRSFSGDDEDIPEEKRNSGEVCLWDCIQGTKVKIMAGSSQNVFEVEWHPTLASFIVATSPFGIVDSNVRTQIRIFRSEVGGFTEFQILDCPAPDLNGLTIKPNSRAYCYVTAAATDSKVYVWDTSQGDKPVHIFCHGKTIDNITPETNPDDVGVNFTAWGLSCDRFYTGSSDGLVKVWNPRNRSKPFIRTLLAAEAQITSGSFSEDFSMLAIGDASGTMHLFSLDDPNHDGEATKIDSLSNSASMRSCRYPAVQGPSGFPCLPNKEIRAVMNKKQAIHKLIDHETPSPPEGAEDPADYSRHLLNSRQITLNPNPTIGAVQGPEYASTGYFRHEAHLELDPAQPLLAEWERDQLESIAASFSSEHTSIPRLNSSNTCSNLARVKAQHLANLSQDLDLLTLSPRLVQQLKQEGADFKEADYGEDFDLED